MLIKTDNSVLNACLKVANLTNFLTFYFVFYLLKIFWEHVEAKKRMIIFILWIFITLSVGAGFSLVNEKIKSLNKSYNTKIEVEKK
jgi:hypothetical protein